MHNTETRRQKTALQFQHPPPLFFSQCPRSHGSKSKSTNKDQQRPTKTNKDGRKPTSKTTNKEQQRRTPTDKEQDQHKPTKFLSYEAIECETNVTHITNWSESTPISRQYHPRWTNTIADTSDLKINDIVDASDLRARRHRYEISEIGDLPEITVITALDEPTWPRWQRWTRWPGWQN